ncbi:MAG: imidazole glycerol phosphate synthase subunit HisH [Lachnospiraceae bacterium]|nr:imidazole glycerol phosphate synthase subunit HisH [Lachnospiraceae bacterium]MDO4408149.1 imidazole glycerol phosphate synthase subunit HisH [Eubacteriales bacterium]
MTAIIDYDAGNIKSVENALRFLGHDVVVTADPEVILQADHVILPGVGAFGEAMQRLRGRGLEDTIREVVDRGTPFLGICLGLQLLFEESEESPGVRGLALLPGRIRRIPDGEGRKVPQIGWNDISFPGESRLFKGLPQGSFVYFVHSFYLEAGDRSDVAATTEYGVSIDAAVEHGNLFACQFHPEKSERVGMQILENFLAVR